MPKSSGRVADDPPVFGEGALLRIGRFMAMWLMWRIKAVFRTIQGDLPPIVAFSLTIK
jgi:hypothetical protein